MADTVVITLLPSLAKRLDEIRRRYGFTREEMIRLMIGNYPTVAEQATGTGDPLERHALAQIDATLEETQRHLNRARTVVAEWRNTLNTRALTDPAPGGDER